MKKQATDFAKLKSRPPVKLRLFYSEAVEHEIEQVSKKIKNPDLKRMFIQCLPNTLDTTAHYYENRDGTPDTFITTGDIPAMWLRDSTNQVWPYLQFISKDESLKKLFGGLIQRQAKSIVLDPYANAFVNIKRKTSKKEPVVPKRS